MAPRIEVTDRSVSYADEVLTPQALEFVAALDVAFHARRDELLAARVVKRAAIKADPRLDFLPHTASVRAGDWTVAPIPADLQDRRVEITGPTDPKMAINALNSGAKVWLADLEDSNTPHWRNQVQGQWVLHEAIRRTLEFRTPEKEYRLRTDAPLAVINVRPRGWHFDEPHVLVDGRPMVAALFDAGMYLFHNAAHLVTHGGGPYFYLAKQESHLEVRLWNDVFALAQDLLGVPRGSVRATVLIETITAAFEMDEILYELREHAAGLNAGRWDYLFSIIKNFRDAGPDFVLPDRADLTMTAPMMRAYTELLVRTCHRRNALAIGGMAAFIPSRKDADVNRVALEKVRADKTREAGDGFDGSWVAHPDLVPVCREVFDSVLGDKPNQVDRKREEVSVTADQLLAIDETHGHTTFAGLTMNIDVALQYIVSWLRGNGAVAIHNLMEDAATAEISRSQIWQQWHNAVVYQDTGQVATKELAYQVIEEQVDRLVAQGFPAADMRAAAAVLERVALADDYIDFLTLASLDALQ